MGNIFFVIITNSKKIKPKLVSLVLVLLLYTAAGFSQTTYTWNATSGGDYQTTTNWTPTRSALNTDDILQFNDGGSYTVTNVPTETIGKLLLSANTTVTLKPNTGSAATLTINTVATGALSVASGSTLNIAGVDAATDRVLTVTSTSNASLTAEISGTLKVTTDGGVATAYGVFTKGASSVINIGASGTYQHDVSNSSGVVIPTCVWASGSTCNITGIIGTACTGLGQAFHHVTWNCASQTVAQEIAYTGTWSGTLTVTSTNTGSLNVGNSGSTYTLTVGTFNQTGGTFNIRGGSASLASNLTVTGNFTLSTNGTFDIALAAGSGTNCNLNVGGNFTHTGSNNFRCTESNSTSYHLTFNGTGTQTIKSTGQNGNSLDIDITNTGAGGNCVIANNTKFKIDGTNSFFDINDNTSIASGELTINGTLELASSATTATFTVAASANIALNDTLKTSMDPTAAFTNSGSITLGGSAVFHYNVAGGTIPTLTWTSGSTCYITGVTGTVCAGLGQSFHHWIWECAGQSTFLHFNETLTTVNGNFSVLNTNSQSLRLASGCQALTLTVGGNFTVSGTSTLLWTASTSCAQNNILNLTGDFTIGAGGTFDFANFGVNLAVNFAGTAQTFTNSGTITNTYMNWTVNSGSIVTLASDLPVATGMTATVTGTLICGTAAAQMNVTGAGAFVLSNATTAELRITNSTNGITASGTATGNILTTGGRTFNTSANYYYMGNAAQITGTGLPATVNNLTIINSGDAAVTLSASVTVNGSCFMTRGSITLGGNTLAYGASGTLVYNSTTAAQTTAAAEFPAASGPNSLTINNTSGVTLLSSANRTINGTITMTAGDLDLNGNTLTMGSSATISGETTAKRIKGSGEISITINMSANSTAYTCGAIGLTITTQGAGNVPGSTIVLRGHAQQTGQNSKTSILRYYTITPTTNTTLGATLKMEFFAAELNGQTANSDMKLWRAESPYGVNDWGQVTSTWNDAATDYVEATGVNAFSRWTVSNNSSSPLPVSLLNFDAKPVVDKIEINWSTASEENNDYFTVERSTDGEVFEEVTKVPGAGNSNTLLFYTAVDNSPIEGTSYYRLKQTDFDGNYSYSDVDAVDLQGLHFINNFKVFPNPASNNSFNIKFFAQQNSEVEVIIYNNIGSSVFKKTVNAVKGDNLFEMELQNGTSGLYFIEIRENGASLKSQVVKL